MVTRIVRYALLAALACGVHPPGWAEKVAELPTPTGYVSDLAGVMTPETKQNLEALCTEVDKQAHAQIAVVTIKTLDDGETVEDFTTQLEDKWKVGQKGTDRGLLMLFVMMPRKGRIEVGYGLEGILNDAKVGDIGRTMIPAAQRDDYNAAIPLGVGEIAQVIAADAGVTLSGTVPQARQYRRSGGAQTVQMSPFQLLLAAGAVLFVLFLLAKTGNLGLLFLLFGNILGGGGGGGGGRGRNDDDGGGGFGGFGGGSSGGGGASGDW